MNKLKRALQLATEEELSDARAPDAFEVVHLLAKTRYAAADTLLFGGSAAKGTQSLTSDIDLVVLFSSIPASQRESFRVGAWLVDAQLHDPETLNYVFTSDARLGSAVLAKFVAEAVLIPAQTSLARDVVAAARTLVSAGPAKCDLSGSRYMIYNMVNDLVSASDQHELMATAGELYKVLALHLLRQNRRWLVSRKMIPRALKDIDDALESDFHNAFHRCFAQHDPEPVISLAQRLIPDLSEGAAFSYTYPQHHRLVVAPKRS